MSVLLTHLLGFLRCFHFNDLYYLKSFECPTFQSYVLSHIKIYGRCLLTFNLNFIFIMVDVSVDFRTLQAFI